MISNEELEQAKAQLLSGQISLRQLSIRMNIDRDALKNMIKGICTPKEQQSLEEVLLDNKASNVVELNEDIKEIINNCYYQLHHFIFFSFIVFCYFFEKKIILQM